MWESLAVTEAAAAAAVALRGPFFFMLRVVAQWLQLVTLCGPAAGESCKVGECVCVRACMDRLQGGKDMTRVSFHHVVINLAIDTHLEH